VECSQGPPPAGINLKFLKFDFESDFDLEHS
jgi:hypothetical protein